MDKHHYLGFKRFAGRGLRYLITWRGHWIALAAGRRVPERRALQASSSSWKQHRLLILGDPGLFPNVASLTLATMIRRLRADWEEAYGHPLLFAETCVDREHSTGHSYQAAGWCCVGNTKGDARYRIRTSLFEFALAF